MTFSGVFPTARIASVQKENTWYIVFSRLFMAGNIRDGTGRDCFDTFDGKKMKTGRDETVK